MKQLHDRLPIHLHILGLFSQTGSMAFWAYLPSTITALEHTVLYLIGTGSHILEKLGYALHFMFLIAIPQQIELILGKVVNCPMNRKIQFGGLFHKVSLPFTQHIPMPACHGIFGHREGTVGENKISVHTFNHASS